MPARKAPWWRDAVFYEIYPRSFQDSNGDGIGDLSGVRARLPYLADLGVEAIWLTPFYPSPQIDFGYDVADYVGVDPQFGTLADYDALVAEAHRLGIRVVIDLVLNHSSDRHPWFEESRRSLRSAKRDWYVWRDGRDGGPPNNWSSAFGPTAWTPDPRTGQYYYHFFYPEQPDLNWRNPEVEAAMFDAVRFWLDRGTDGFRLDAVNWMFEDPEFPDNPLLERLRPGSVTEREQELRYNRDLPETHAVLRRLRRLLDGYPGDRVLIGELWVPSFEHLVEYYGPDDDEVQLPFNFFFTQVERLSAAAFRREVERAEAALAGRPTTWVLSNHDLRRAVDRFGEGENAAAIAKVLALLLLTLRGAPFLYYGEEIAMPTVDPERFEEVRDPVGRRYWPGFKGRDGARRPMLWDASQGAGFTTSAQPWLPLPAQRTQDVAAASADPASVLSFYRAALRLRRGSPALRHGRYASLGAAPGVFAYRRSTHEEELIVVLNLSRQPQEVSVPAGRVRLGTHRASGPENHGSLSLEPLEGLVLATL